MRKLPFFVLISFLLCTAYSSAQNPISLEFIKEQSATSVSDEIGVPSAFAQFDIEYYSITYTTMGSDMQLDTASGLIIIPKDPDMYFPMLTYCHGTVQDRNTGMSNLMAADVDLAAVYGSYGFITVAPDYIGMVESRGFHPYVHADTEASASIDMMRAVSQVLPDISANWNERTFITGYSQGGHAAMATHRELETNFPGEFNIIASFPMSGPYSISEKMIDFTLGDTEYFFVAYLPNVALSMITAYPTLLNGIELEDIFKADYIEDIRKFESQEIDLFELNTLLTDRLVQTDGASIPKNMLLDDALNNIKNNPNHPLSMALADNDVYDWAPQAELKMFYCTSDDQVTYENAILAEQVMIANGSTTVSSENLSDTADHTGCVEPAITAGLAFTLLTRGITSTKDILSVDQLTISPNPTDQLIKIDLDNSLKLDQVVYKLLDQNGQVILQGNIYNHSTVVNMAFLPSGLYLLDIDSNSFNAINRIVKH